MTELSLPRSLPPPRPTQIALVPTKPTLVWHGKTILDLKPLQCRYSVATVEDEVGNPVHLFCSNTTQGGPYCERCAAICYVGVRPLHTSARLVLPRLR